MSSGTLIKEKKVATACMAQIVFLNQPEKARAVVGSCIALTLYHPKARVGALAHIVLPNSAGREGPPGKFADTAIPHMIKTLKEQGATSSGLVAKMCGGASMFAATGPLQIGRENAAAVAALLKELGIPVMGEDLGETQGRRITFDTQTGDVTIDVARQNTRVI